MIRAKIKSTFIEKYGVANPSMTDAVKEKQKTNKYVKIRCSKCYITTKVIK
jgi:hypothetical protein